MWANGKLEQAQPVGNQLCNSINTLTVFSETLVTIVITKWRVFIGSVQGSKPREEKIARSHLGKS